METSLVYLDGWGVGPMTLKVFRAAGFTKVGDLKPRLQQEAAVRAAAEGIARATGMEEYGYWRAMAARCVNIIKKIRNPAHPHVVPEPFICPLRFEELEVGWPRPYKLSIF